MVPTPSTSTKLFLLARNEDGPVDAPAALAAFIIPNQAILTRRPLHDYQVKLDTVERLAGCCFFPCLKDRQSNQVTADARATVDLCGIGDLCIFLGDARTSVWALVAAINAATSLSEINTLVAEAETDGVLQSKSDRSLVARSRQ